MRLSVNLNKVALVRNARSDDDDSALQDCALLAISAGCHGLTLHPRSDQRHATLADVYSLSMLPQVKSGDVELNVEGDARRELLDVVTSCCVHQFTLVPVRNGEKTTERGWSKDDDIQDLIMVREALALKNIRLALFIDPDQEMVDFASENGVCAVEFHTKKYAQLYESGDSESCEPELELISQCAARATKLGLKVNLGHDINLKNLGLIASRVKPDEVSIGHALVLDAIKHGIAPVVKCYLGELLK